MLCDKTQQRFDMKISRRKFVEHTAYATAGTLCLGLIGCETAEATKPTETLSCNDTTGLTPEQIKGRENLQYVDVTPVPSKRCDNCNLWVAAPAEGKCGGCKIMKGPIHPGGYCTAWAPGVAKPS